MLTSVVSTQITKNDPKTNATSSKATVKEQINIVRIPRKRKTKTGLKVYLSRDWYLRIMRSGRRRWINLGPDQKAALKRARTIKNESDISGTASGLVIERAATAPTGITVSIGELTDLLQLRAAMFEKTSPRTLKSYVASLMIVLRDVLSEANGRVVDAGQVRDLPSTILTEQIIRKFVELRQCVRGKSTKDRRLGSATLESAKRTANRHLRNARALLNPTVIFKLREEGHKVPDFAGFRSAPLAQNTRKIFRMPDNATIARVACAIRNELPEIAGSGFYCAALLALHAGLRREEITHARWDWISPGKPSQITIAADDEFKPKADRVRSIRITNWLRNELLRFKPDTDPQGSRAYVISGNSRPEVYANLVTLTDWLRTKGVEGGKPLHELRKWFGAFFAGAYGLTRAQWQLGHTTPLVTNDYYAGIRSINQGLCGIWEKPQHNGDYEKVMAAVHAADESGEDDDSPFGIRPEPRW